MLIRFCFVAMIMAISVPSNLVGAQVVEQRDPFSNDPDQIVQDKLERMIEIAGKRADGRVIRVKYSFRGLRMTSGTHGSGMTSWSRDGYIEIGGPEDTLPELERVEEGGEANEVVFDYHMIDYARDLLEGKFSDQVADVADSQRDQGGAELLRMSRMQVVEEAVGAYGMHLSEQPEDWFAMREMAVALLELGRVEDAHDLMYVAYLQEPELGIFPISSLLYGEFFEVTIKKLVISAVQHTNRKPSAEGWLTVGVLMQAQGRVGLAGEMLDRAEGLGLDPQIVKSLREALP